MNCRHFTICTTGVYKCGTGKVKRKHTISTQKRKKKYFYACICVEIARRHSNSNSSLTPKRLLGVSMFVVWLYKWDENIRRAVLAYSYVIWSFLSFSLHSLCVCAVNLGFFTHSAWYNKRRRCVFKSAFYFPSQMGWGHRNMYAVEWNTLWYRFCNKWKCSFCWQCLRAYAHCNEHNIDASNWKCHFRARFLSAELSQKNAKQLIRLSAIKTV